MLLYQPPQIDARVTLQREFCRSRVGTGGGETDTQINKGDEETLSKRARSKSAEKSGHRRMSTVCSGCTMTTACSPASQTPQRRLEDKIRPIPLPRDWVCPCSHQHARQHTSPVHLCPRRFPVAVNGLCYATVGPGMILCPGCSRGSDRSTSKTQKAPPTSRPVGRSVRQQLRYARALLRRRQYVALSGARDRITSTRRCITIFVDGLFIRAVSQDPPPPRNRGSCVLGSVAAA